MSQNKCNIRYEKGIGRQNLFYNDPYSDFYILLDEKLFCLRKQFLKPSGYLTQRILQNQRVHVILEKINIQTMEKVLAYIYGIPILMQSIRQIDSVMSIAKFLQFQQLEYALKKQIQKKFNEYDLLVLLDLACTYADQQLQQRCLQELIKQNFQQLNINRYELLKCSQNTFSFLIKSHQQSKTSGKITGLKFQNIRKIVAQYNSLNKSSVDILTVLTSPLQQIIIEDPEGQKDSPQPIFASRLKKYQSVNNNKNQSELFLTQVFNRGNRKQIPRQLTCHLRRIGKQANLRFNCIQQNGQGFCQNNISSCQVIQKNYEVKSQKSTSPKSEQNIEQKNSFNKDISKYFINIWQCQSLSKERKNSGKENLQEFSPQMDFLGQKQNYRQVKSEQKKRK